MIATFYSFSKRKNSTKQVTGTGTQKTIYFKEDTSINKPSIVLDGNDFTYDYVHISEFGRYYFVDDTIVLTNGMTQYNLSEDTLATEKTSIGATVAEIAFSSTGYDIWKNDSRIPTKNVINEASSSGVAPGIFSASGCFILTVVNNTSNSGMTSQYIVSIANMQTLAQDLFTSTTLKQELKEYLTSPFDAITDCKWLPFDASEAPGSSETIVLGVTPTNATGIKLANPCVKKSSATVSIPWQYNDFRRSTPYTTLAAWIPGYSYIDLNSAELTQLTSLKFEFCCDWGCGDICCNIIHPVSSIIYQSMSYNVAVAVPISQITLDIGGIVNSTTNFLGSAADTGLAVGALSAGGAISGAFSMLMSGASAILASNRRVVSSKGGIGGRATINEGINVVIYSFSVETENPDAANYIAVWGRPVGQSHAISNHSGYVQCINASVNMAGDNYEREEINTYLNSGFYYE